ncbi:ATP-binding cassette transporter [Dacryopinax primogenitus]|uniref:ATP-binding cassette transporter n=1 Tax=Dacryopinax primogenitus (strain DJM 731) TaxID=1858805 RepID=M5G690_DACPD|nr:ATP-binding cassette transporter [Dacryopinax primogenitus]EJU04204.1 ATP-binding cassette transporter [Dacryopinax primogenitus]
MPEAVFSVKNLTYTIPNEKEPLFHDVSFEVNKGDVVIIRGPSGCGKTTLLKCLSHLNVYSGRISLFGKTPKQYGVPSYRTKVCYVPQRPSMLPGTPMGFLKTVHTFKSRQAYHTSEQDAIESALKLSEHWNITSDLWDKDWTGLSGGEAQRIALAVAVSLPGAVVLLVDEPTSALDEATSEKVENSLIELCDLPESSIEALIWITHSDEQAERVGTRTLTLEKGTGTEGVHLVSA